MPVRERNNHRACFYDNFSPKNEGQNIPEHTVISKQVDNLQLLVEPLTVSALFE